MTTNNAVNSLLFGTTGSGSFVGSIGPTFSAITVTGNVASATYTGSWVGNVISMTYGGTGAALTPAINSLVFSGASALELLASADNGLLVTSNTGVPSILVGPGTSNYPLLSNAAAAPSFATVPFPSAPGWTAYTPTVTLVGGTGNVVPTFSTQLARYSQVGNVVTVSLDLQNSSGGTDGAGTGTLNVALPIPAGSGIAGGTVGGAGVLGSAGSAYLVVANMTASSSTVTFTYISVATPAALTGAGFSNATRSIQITFSYEV